MILFPSGWELHLAFSLNDGVSPQPVDMALRGMAAVAAGLLLATAFKMAVALY